MKIVFKNENNETKCLAQIRDFKYLAIRFDSKFFLTRYNSMRAHGQKDEDFVEITNEKTREIILNCSYIVDFSEFAKLDLVSLSRFVVLSSGSTGPKDRLDNDHRRVDLQDIADFKNGLLPYRIPVTFDNNVFMDMGPVYFGSSTIPGYYMLRKKDVSVDLMNFLYTNYYLLYANLDAKDVCTGFDSVKVGDDVLFKFKTRTKLQQKIEDIKKKLS